MNIIFEKLKFKNLMSYGDKFTEIDFNNGIDLLEGKNASGKSSIPDALFYSLFGKPFRKVKTSSLINRLSKKNLECQLTFAVDSKKYKIIRGIKPNKFEIYVSCEEEFTLIEQRAATKDYQKYLEEDILKLNDTIFRQLIVLGANIPSSKPFMELSSSEKESLFQVLTDTSIFGFIKQNIKNRISENKQTIKDLQYKTDILKSSIESETLMIEQAEKQNEDFKTHHKDNISETKNNIESAKDNIDKCNNGLQKLKELKVEYDEKNLLFQKLEEDFASKQKKDSEIINKLRDNSFKEYNDNISKIEEDYNSLNYDEYLREIDNYKSLIIEDTKNKHNLDLKIKTIESAEKDSIKCVSCSTTNYLMDISEDEVKCKVHYKEDIQKIMDNTNDLQTKINKKEKELKTLKEKDIALYNSKKEKELNNKITKEQEIKAKNENILEMYKEERNKIDETRLIVDSYREKLLNGKRVKEVLEDNKEKFDFYSNKLVELESVKIVEINYDSLNEKNENFTLFSEDLNNAILLADDLIYLEKLINGNNLKGAVIKKQIPFLNKGINHFLELFSMVDYSFVIDENFKETLITKDDNSEFNSLSNGQKSRISFSIMFAFLKLIEERNGVKTNLLILDEVLDSSVDSSGREELLEILSREFSNKKDIIIISHNDQVKEKIELFDRLITVTRDKFSTINIEEI